MRCRLCKEWMYRAHSRWICDTCTEDYEVIYSEPKMNGYVTNPHKSFRKNW